MILPTIVIKIVLSIGLFLLEKKTEIVNVEFSTPTKDYNIILRKTTLYYLSTRFSKTPVGVLKGCNIFRSRKSLKPPR